jgi:hypothetical protein
VRPIILELFKTKNSRLKPTLAIRQGIYSLAFIKVVRREKINNYLFSFLSKKAIISRHADVAASAS